MAGGDDVTDDVIRRFDLPSVDWSMQSALYNVEL